MWTQQQGHIKSPNTSVTNWIQNIPWSCPHLEITHWKSIWPWAVRRNQKYCPWFHTQNTQRNAWPPLWQWCKVGWHWFHQPHHKDEYSAGCHQEPCKKNCMWWQNWGSNRGGIAPQPMLNSALAKAALKSMEDYSQQSMHLKQCPLQTRSLPTWVFLLSINMQNKHNKQSKSTAKSVGFGIANNIHDKKTRGNWVIIKRRHLKKKHGQVLILFKIFRQHMTNNSRYSWKQLKICYEKLWQLFAPETAMEATHLITKDITNVDASALTASAINTRHLMTSVGSWMQMPPIIIWLGSQ